jgi:hypothetical protein
MRKQLQEISFQRTADSKQLVIRDPQQNLYPKNRCDCASQFHSFCADAGFCL